MCDVIIPDQAKMTDGRKLKNVFEREDPKHTFIKINK